MGLPEGVSVIAWGLSLERYSYFILLPFLRITILCYCFFIVFRPTMIKYGVDNIRDVVGPKVNLQMVATHCAGWTSKNCIRRSYVCFVLFRFLSLILFECIGSKHNRSLKGRSNKTIFTNLNFLFVSSFRLLFNAFAPNTKTRYEQKPFDK